ncbi:MAG: hypothetical protein QOE54_5680 [Streptosporangiaceae bacterium]|jgi:hypothetical protein|nr:hypothetical protein [Streptosporangiaceae bacterium]MDX6433314.1 hypothetical protein [Streptosporangiaceae bacterium]
MTTTEQVPAEVDQRRRDANAEALRRIVNAEPALIDVAAAAGDVVPGMDPQAILTSGAPLDWPGYTGGQRRTILYSAIYEGLALPVAFATGVVITWSIRRRDPSRYGRLLEEQVI